VFPPQHADNPRPDKEFIHVQSSGLSLAEVRGYLLKATDTVTIQLLLNTIKRDLEQNQPLVQIPGMVPPRGAAGR
jgi:hypothetical protein